MGHEEGYHLFAPAGAALGGFASAALFSRVLGALIAGGVLRQGAAAFQGRPVGPLLQEVLAAAPRTLSFALWTLPLELLTSASRRE